MMWRILFLGSIVCLATLTNGQQTPEPPRITKFLTKDLLAPEDVKFKIDNAMKLPCAASGNNLEWTWKHNNTEISAAQIQHGNQFKVSADGTLTGSNLGSSQSGNYQCIVKDNVTNVETFSRKIQVAVTVVGTFRNPIDVEVRVDLGEELSYRCPSHNPSYGVSYSWGGKLSDADIQFKSNDRRAISPTGQLFIMYVTQQDFDEVNGFQNQGIRCTISGANSYQRSGLLKILKKTPGKYDPGTTSAPSWRKIPGMVEKAVEGRNKTLYCLAAGRPAPTITWKKNGVTIVHGQNSYEIPSMFQGRLLNIVNVQRDKHQDTYSCEAENSESNGYPLVYHINLIVEAAPRWTTEAPEASKTIAGNGSLTCDVFAHPAPSFKWYKNGKQIFVSTNNVRLNNNTLNFYKVRYPDETGVYQCVAENQHGMIVSSTWLQVLAIVPSFKQNGFGPFYLFEETEGRLKCNPKAAPRPNMLKWYKEGQELQTTTPPYSVEADGTLVIDTVIRERDTGEYECYAENFLGNDSAKARASVFERTRIMKAPQDKKIVEGTHVDLQCEATADPSLQLRYLWKRDNAIITYNKKIQWLEGAKVLRIANITVDDAGIYTCVAYTSEPARSQDSKSVIVNVTGVPFPPSNLRIIDCFNRTTTLFWISGAANNALITHFLIEQESTYEPNVFRVIANVTKPNATSLSLNLTEWATLRFRVRAVNRFGASRASLPTAEPCQTKVGAPDKYPDNLRVVPRQAGDLDIAWTAMPKVDWNAPGLYYILNYRSLPNGTVVTHRINDSSVSVFRVPNPGYYKQWGFQMQAGNDQGVGPMSPLVTLYSVPDPPSKRPEDVKVGAVGAHTVELLWRPVDLIRGRVDGYRIYYWGESHLNTSNTTFIEVPGGNAKRHTVTQLTPNTNYTMVIKAFNSNGEGPSSIEVFASTEEAAPGRPSDVQVYAFAKYILVTWKAPLEPNGIITKYRVGSKEYPGSQPADDLAVNAQEVSAAVNRKLLGNHTPEKNYVVEIEARTRKGWGQKFKKTTATVKYAAPAKPERPTVEGTTVDKVKVIYNIGFGAGYTHEFLVMYRKKSKEKQFKNTSWLNYFETQSTKIEGLSPDLYEFKTVGRNDYPNNSNESPASDVTEKRLLPGVFKPAGPPSNVEVYAFAKYILVTWKAPLESNDIITKYRVGSKQYPGSQPADVLAAEMQEVSAGVYRKLLGDQTPEKNHVVEIQAHTRKGWGDKIRKTTTNVKYSAPAKPEKPTVDGIAVDKVKVTYNFGLGGGYTHEFLVMYRKKGKGDAYKNTSWVNHFETQSAEIGGLSPELYEFKTVGRNDYPNDSNESPESDVTEESPLQGVVNAATSFTTPSRLYLWILTLWFSFFCVYSYSTLIPRR